MKSLEFREDDSKQPNNSVLKKSVNLDNISSENCNSPNFINGCKSFLVEGGDSKNQPILKQNKSNLSISDNFEVYPIDIFIENKNSSSVSNHYPYNSININPENLQKQLLFSRDNNNKIDNKYSQLDSL